MSGGVRRDAIKRTQEIDGVGYGVYSRTYRNEPRPPLVLDPDDAEQVERLAIEYVTALNEMGPRKSVPDALTTALRSLLAPSPAPSPDLVELEAAADAAYERFTAAASYYSAASDAHVAASSALAVAIAESKGDKR